MREREFEGPLSRAGVRGPSVYRLASLLDAKASVCSFI
jgi:hypothetical protein